MSETTSMCQICKDPILDDHEWAVEEKGNVHFSCHLKTKLDAAETRLKEAEWLVANACENRSVVTHWIARRDAFLERVKL